LLAHESQLPSVLTRQEGLRKRTNNEWKAASYVEGMFQ